MRGEINYSNVWCAKSTYWQRDDKISAFSSEKIRNPCMRIIGSKTESGPFDMRPHARVAIHTFVYQSATNNEAFIY